MILLKEGELMRTGGVAKDQSLALRFCVGRPVLPAHIKACV